MRRRPVMVHRSLVGSLERLFAHLIEVHQGAFPAWYAPVQVVVLPVGEDQADAAAAFGRACVAAGLRAEVSYDAIAREVWDETGIPVTGPTIRNWTMLVSTDETGEAVA